MNNEPNKPIPAQELTDKELEGISGGSNGAAAYFNELFDMENQGNPAWAPYVDVELRADFAALKGSVATLT